MFRELKFRRFQFLLIFIFSTSFIIYGKTNGIFIENYKDLKNQISDKDSKVIPYLIFGIVIGRIFEKIVRAKKKLFKKRK